MFRNRTVAPREVSILLAILFTAMSCSHKSNDSTSTSNRNVEQSLSRPSSQSSPVSSADSPVPETKKNDDVDAPPRKEEISGVVSRVYESVAIPDASTDPGFVVGDFNGDGSEDIAVVVKAASGKLGQINDELANWVVEDPRLVPIPSAAAVATAPAPKPAYAEEGKPLLAIVHGVGEKGWRDPEARQSFLLKNATGANMSVKRFKFDSEKDPKLTPLAPKGDAIVVRIGGRSGFLFWTGAKYAWKSIDDDAK